VIPYTPDETERGQYGVNSPRLGTDAINISPMFAELPYTTLIVEEYDSKPDCQVLGKEENNDKTSSESYLIPVGIRPDSRPETKKESEPEIPGKPASIPEPETTPKPVPEIIITAPWRPNELLPPQTTKQKGKKCLILDLDETLVHSSFQSVDCDFEIPVDIEGIVRTIHVAKRPHVDEFMKVCGELFEVVVFTASLAKYADPLLDLLDIHKVIDHRLFRESCTQHNGTYVKDLFRIGRPLHQIIIIDNSPHSYSFNPQNAIPCESWFDDRSDNELLLLLEILRRIADPSVDDVIKELEALEVSATCSSLGYPYSTEQYSVTLPETVNESEEEVCIVVESESDGDAQWNVN